MQEFQRNIAEILRQIFDSTSIFISLVSEIQLIDIQGSILTVNFDVEHYNSEPILQVIQDLYSDRTGAGLLMSVNLSWRRDLLMCSGDGCTQSRF